MPESAQQTIQSFIDYLKFEKRYSPHTITSYSTDLVDFFDFSALTFGTTDLGSIKSAFVRSWLASLKEKGLSSKSLNRKISSLKSFFKYHLKTGSISTTPMGNVISPKINKRLPVFVKETETITILESVNQQAEDWKSLNGKMLITIFYATGMRLSELINLRENQIDSARGQLKVLGKGNKERIIPISKEVVDTITTYGALKRKEFSVFDDFLLVTEKGKKLYPRYAWKLVSDILGVASTLDKKSPHVLRHTFATHLMNNGANLNAVKELLGHSSLASTQVYTHNTIDKLKDVHKKAHPKA